MKKRIVSVLMLFIMCLGLSACTAVDTNKLGIKYFPDEKQCVIKNISDENYKDLKVNLVAETPEGFEKEIVASVGELKKEESYIYDLNDEDILDNNISVYIKSCEYYTSPWEIVACMVLVIFIGLLILFLGIILCG